MITFEKLIATYLRSHKQSPEQAAPSLGVGYVAIYAWLKGDYQPSSTKMPRLAEAMGISEDLLRKAVVRSRQDREKRRSTPQGGQP